MNLTEAARWAHEYAVLHHSDNSSRFRNNQSVSFGEFRKHEGNVSF